MNMDIRIGWKESWRKSLEMDSRTLQNHCLKGNKEDAISDQVIATRIGFKHIHSSVNIMLICIIISNFIFISEFIFGIFHDISIHDYVNQKFWSFVHLFTSQKAKLGKTIAQQTSRLIVKFHTRTVRDWLLQLIVSVLFLLIITKFTNKLT